MPVCQVEGQEEEEEEEREGEIEQIVLILSLSVLGTRQTRQTQEDKTGMFFTPLFLFFGSTMSDILDHDLSHLAVMLSGCTSLPLIQPVDANQAPERKGTFSTTTPTTTPYSRARPCNRTDGAPVNSNSVNPFK